MAAGGLHDQLIAEVQVGRLAALVEEDAVERLEAELEVRSVEAEAGRFPGPPVWMLVPAKGLTISLSSTVESPITVRLSPPAAAPAMIANDSIPERTWVVAWAATVVLPAAECRTT